MGHTGLVIFISAILSISQTWSKPFNVYWNIPTILCKNNFGIDFTFVVNDYGIAMNDGDEFKGNKISIYYNPGLYPRIYNYTIANYVHETDYKNLYYVNGGIPQNGNMSIHCDEFERQIKTETKDVRNDGLIIIDMEHWGATWNQNFNDMEIYRIESRLKTKKAFPNLSEAEIEAKAKLEYEKNADKFLSGTLQLAKSTRPYAKWGYYQYPQCFNQPGENFCSEKTQLENNQMIRMWKLSDALFPSLYLANVSNVAGRAAQIRGAVKEGFRVAQYANKTLLQIPYIWTKYFFVEEDNILDADLENLIKIPKEEGADGVIVWGASADFNTADKCNKYKDYVKSTLGPMAKKYISTT